MSLMPDPLNVLHSLQQALHSGMTIEPSELDAGYKTFYDEPFKGGRRFSFAKIIGDQVSVMSIFGLEDLIDGVVCYNVGYAVKQEFRGQGLAVEAVSFGIQKLKDELEREGLDAFYIEAVIDLTNVHSIKVAERVFPSKGIKMKDHYSGTPSLYFKMLVSIG